MLKSFKLTILISLLTLSCEMVFGTEQAPDRLIYQGDTLSLFANPLEQLFRNGTPRPDIFKGKEACWTTGCWRGYQATWTIIEKQLYLTEIASCCFSEDGIKADLKELFGSKYADARVKVDWYTDTVIAPQGKVLYYGQLGYSSLHEKELELRFKNGRLTGTTMYDNSKSRPSVYYGNRKKLEDFIYSNINWSKLPGAGKKVIRVVAYFSANENGVVDSVRIMPGSPRKYDRETVRVIKSIPDWDIVYQHGKFRRRQDGFRIVFSEANKLKYWNSRRN